MQGVVLSIVATIAGLIVLYNIIKNPNAVVAIAKTAGGFTLAETKALTVN